MAGRAWTTIVKSAFAAQRYSYTYTYPFTIRRISQFGQVRQDETEYVYEYVFGKIVIAKRMLDTGLTLLGFFAPYRSRLLCIAESTR